MRVGDHQLHPAQAPTRQRAQEARPERLGLRGPDAHAQHFALPVGVHRDGDYHGHRDDPPGLPHLHVGRVDPQIRPVAFDRAIQERPHPLVDLGAQPRDLALGDPAHPHRLHQLVDRAGGDALDVGLLDHRGERLLGRPTRLEEPGEVAALSELRDLQVDRAGAGLPEPVAVAVAAVGPLGASLAEGRSAAPLDVHLHHALGDVLDHLAQQVGVGPLLSKLGQCHSLTWSSCFSSVQVGGSHLNLTEEPR